MKDLVFFVYLNQKLSLGPLFWLHAGPSEQREHGGNIFENMRGVGGKCGSEVGINSRGQMTFCLLPDILAQWVEQISEADYFFLILCSRNILQFDN